VAKRKPKTESTDQAGVIAAEAIDQAGMPKPTSCPACGSPDREPYFNIRRQAHDGGVIVWRRTRCRVCGQIRDDRTTE
jgi:hypothetical protein